MWIFIAQGGHFRLIVLCRSNGLLLTGSLFGLCAFGTVSWICWKIVRCQNIIRIRLKICDKKYLFWGDFSFLCLFPLHQLYPKSLRTSVEWWWYKQRIILFFIIFTYDHSGNPHFLDPSWRTIPASCVCQRGHLRTGQMNWRSCSSRDRHPKVGKHSNLVEGE